MARQTAGECDVLLAGFADRDRDQKSGGRHRRSAAHQEQVRRAGRQELLGERRHRAGARPHDQQIGLFAPLFGAATAKGRFEIGALEPRLRQARDFSGSEPRRLPHRAGGVSEPKRETGMQQDVKSANPDADAIARLETESPGVVLRPHRLDRQVGLAEAPRRVDHPHSGRRRELQAQALLGADERHFVDDPVAERR